MADNKLKKHSGSLEFILGVGGFSYSAQYEDVMSLFTFHHILEKREVFGLGI